ncbi:MAG TPA: immunoglobulin-like domain-containing protein [Candidatus Paceibacterota bacterium]|nr:immunoglobulin-like domain-containing protein [Candidatus Paceibacterota bacterium]
MRNILFFIIVLSFLVITPVKIYADEMCSKNGYTILTINGMLSDETDAKKIKYKLEEYLPNSHNNQSLKIDYLYNPSHLAGIGDTVDILAQGLLDYKNDYDLTEILKDASEKIKTQKVLLVAHSQGNFYANNIYDKIVDVSGGVPKESIQVYGVASPDNRVVGGGKYLNSDTDWTINKLAKNFLIDILPPNVHISLGKNDGDGHSFSDVYMKYQGDRIVSDIQSLLNKIKPNNTQSPNEPCISTPKISVAHNGLKVILAIADPLASVGNYITNGVERATAFAGRNISRLLASAGSILGDTNTSLPPQSEGPTLKADETSPVISNQTSSPAETTQEPPKDNVGNSSSENGYSTEKILPTNSDDSNNTDKKHHSGGGGSSTSEVPTCSDLEVLMDGICVLKQSEENPTPPVTTEDITAPTISLVGESILNIIKDSTYEDLGATATDEIDGDLTSAIVKSGTFVDTTILGSYTIIYTVSDLSNNSSSITRTINIIEPEPPIEDDEEEEESDFIIDKDTILTYGEYNYNNLRITNNAVLTLEGSPSSIDTFKGVKINAKNITIDSGSYITADNQGYNKGPGSPSDQEASAGSTYGGAGLRNTLISKYGSAVEPTDLGSGGINNYRGGGAIILSVEESILNNGTISANGDVSSSGGSVYIKAKNISGNGNISANGGAATHVGGNTSGTGGGGRIALYYENFSLTGKVEALGGCAQYDGFSMTCAGNGTVGLFDTVNNNLLVNSFWAFEKNNSPFNLNKIILTDKAIVTSEKDTTINASELIMDGTSEFTLGEDQIIDISNISLKNSSKITSSGEESITSEILTLSDNSVITVVPEKVLTLEIPNINIEKGASIIVDAKGYIDGLGAPIGQSFAGASYGGLGGNNTTAPIYGDEMKPVDFGSGGYGNFHGGGAVRLIVTNTLLNNGLVSAMGEVTSSGGSIYITAKNVSGNGVFSSNGGGAYCGGICTAPGAGGRIAIYYENNSFTGTAEALGGWGSFSGWAGNGSVKLINSNEIEDDPDPIIPEVKSSEKLITSFNFESLNPIVTGDINNTDYTVKLEVPYNTSITDIIPTIITSDKSAVSPSSTISQDFTNPVTYIVTAEDGSTQTYIVTVNVLPDPNIPPENTLPTITSYSLNGSQSNLIINPLINDVTLVLNSNKNVNWMYIDIEKEDEPTRHKFFHAGEDCKNSSSCTKIWEDGVLSEGGLLKSGTYRVWVHIKDAEGNEYEGYLPSIISVNIE